MLARAYRTLKALYRIKRDPDGYARSIGVRLGEGCWLSDITTKTFGTEPYLVTIGSKARVASGVRFVTHDGSVLVYGKPGVDLIAPITMEENSFVGMNTVLLPGVTIGANSIVGAGSVVSRDIPPNVVAAGVPARVLCTLEEHWARIEPRLLPTGGMTPEEKRAWCEAHFNLP
jgi:acetyltransferase-like isoleucine patch superfamily enzyme